MTVSLWILLGMRNISDKKLYRKSKHTRFMFNNFFSEIRTVYEMKWNSRTGHRRQYNMAHALTCRINTATDTHSEYVILTVFLFHCKKLFTRMSPQRYVIRTLHVLFSPTVLLPPWSKITFLCASEVVVPLQPLAHGVLQCLVIRVMVSSQTLIQRNKAMNIWCWEVRNTVHPNLVMASAVWSGVVVKNHRFLHDWQRRTFNLLSISI
jgi:hypothetical protein